nr:M56 family metallopeptidase [Lachnospiraceae bacterium]
SFLCVCIPRISYENGVKAYRGEFVCSTVPPMTITFYILGSIWLVGFLFSVVWAGVRKWRLIQLMKGNVPVENLRYFELFEECRRQEELDNIALSQNDLLRSPITVGIIRKQIILSFADYTDTELRMIYEHELTHIKNRDLHWRMLSLVTSWIHWFNPVIYRYEKELNCVQEMICDLSISIDNTYYTKKEYAAYLARLADQDAFNAYTLALSEDKNQTTRRIKEMAKTKKFIKPQKWMMGVSCACLTALTMIPSIAVSAEAAKLQEDWMRAEEVVTIEVPQDFSDPSIEVHGYDDGRVVEVDGSQEIEPRSATVDLEKEISAYTRYIYQYRSMSKGDSILISTKCDSSITYSIGIKNKQTGEMTSISGTGTLQHEFKITKDGTYSAYVENSNSFPISVTGSAVY